MKLYVARYKDGDDKTSTPIKVYNATFEDEKYSVTTSSTVATLSGAYGSKTDIEPLTFNVTSGNYYSIWSNNAGNMIFAIELVKDTGDKESLTVSGTYEPSGAKLEASNGATVKYADGSYTLTFDKGDKAGLTVSADDYITKSFEYEEAKTNENISLTAVTATGDGTSYISRAKFTSGSSVLKNKYENVDGFTLTPSGNGVSIFADSNYANRLQLTVGSTISYIPEKDGVITVTGASANSTATDRGFTFTSSDDTETFDDVTYSSSTNTDKKFNVTAGKTYTLTATGGNINIDRVEFGLKSAFNNANVVEKDGTLYIYAEISAEDVANENITAVGIANGKQTVQMSTSEVAKSVEDGDVEIVTAADGKYYAAVKVTKSASDSETLNIVPFTVVSGEKVYGDAITYPAAN
jgi:hypothetical protein